MRYGAIMADPPWNFRTYSARGEGRSATQHYPTMKLADILALDVRQCAADDCALFLWATDPNLKEAFACIEAWGFTYKTVAFTWAKTTKSGLGWHVGMGYWTRANAEQCLLATIGHPQRLSASVRRLIVAPVREHSRKPDEAYDGVRELVGGPYLEMFARQRRPGWAAWGNDIDHFKEQVA